MNPMRIAGLLNALLAVAALVRLARTRGLPFSPSRTALMLQIVLIPFAGSLCFLLRLRSLRKYRSRRAGYARL